MLLQQAASERDDLIIILQYVLQQKMKITAQQRESILAALPPAPPSKSGGASPPRSQAHLMPKQKILASLVPAEIAKITDTLVPIAAALVPQDYSALIDIFSVLADDGAFTPHIIASSTAVCPSSDTANGANGPMPAEEYMWKASLLSLPSQQLASATIVPARTLPPRLAIFTSSVPAGSVYDVFIDIPPLLQFNAVGRRKVSNPLHRAPLIAYNHAVSHLIKREIKTMLQEQEEDVPAHIGEASVVYVRSPVLPPSATSVTLRHSKVVASDYGCAEAAEFFDKEVCLDENVLSGAVAEHQVAGVFASQSHIALVVVTNDTASWLFGYLSRQREKKSRLGEGTSTASATSLSAVILIDRSTYEPDESLVSNCEGVSIVALPHDLPHPASSTRASFNTERGLLVIANGNRTILVDLFEDEEEDEECEEYDNANE